MTLRKLESPLWISDARRLEANLTLSEVRSKSHIEWKVWLDLNKEVFGTSQERCTTLHF